MIVVDSSAWMEFYRSSGDPVVSEAVAVAVANDDVWTNGIIQSEIVSFAPDRATFRKLAADFEAFHWLDLRKEDFDLATSIGFDLRRHGTTVPANDLIIAASTILAEAELYHVDSHFEAISKHTKLRETNLKHR